MNPPEGYQTVLRHRYPWIDALAEMRQASMYGDVLCVRAGERTHYITIDPTGTDEWAMILKRLDEVQYNRMVAADTEDWTDRP